MKTLAGIILALAICGSASAGTFQVGIADPGPGPISTADVSALGLSVERRTVEWHGESTFDGELTWTPGLRAIAAVYGSAEFTPTTGEARTRYCDFVLSIIERYPQVSDVVIWNEPNLSGFWNGGLSTYLDLLEGCAGRIRTAGARVLGPALSPATAGIATWAREIGAHPGLLDVWVQHEYWTPSDVIEDQIATVRSALGWRIPFLVSESEVTDLARAYCAGADGWMNFKLRDNGDWLSTGLRYEDGSRKPAYSYVEVTRRQIDAGTFACWPPPPSPQPVAHPPGRNAWILRQATRG